MVGAQELATQGAGVGAGVGSTLLVRRELDATGETTVLRPSVLWGLGTGAVAMVGPGLMGMRGGVADFAKDYGLAAFGAGLFSAFSPKGGGVQLPTV